MERFEVSRLLTEYEERVADLSNALDISALETELKELNKQMLDPNFWNDQNNARKVTKRISEVENNLNTFKKLSKDLESLKEWFEISEKDTEEWEILMTELNSFTELIEEFSIQTLLSEPYDNNNCILTIQAGAGGTEAQDWAEMLQRMYLRYASRMNYKTEILDYQPGDEAGIKSVMIMISGPFAYGYLKAEIGIHRLVRISPFDANKKRHTSFAAVEVVPEVDDDVEIDIKEEDIKVDVYRSGGAGGQSVNTTDSAVRITHLPTKIVVTCQNERSQIQNRETAMKILSSKLLQLELEKKEEELMKLKGEQKSIGWGSQIRSYVFHPYQMVKDLRTNEETSQIDDVMDGKLENFINAYLKWR
ncbi:MAG TPA: peptide chain release factor 2 [Acholeplasmataceae bacterium]|jgi:peptide chain release factor 2|nr:peptide chain release factor 2 [Acholeplasmataceae bacterium]